MEKRIFKDQLNREININFPPQRIISLVPSQTELLFDLGLNTEIVGITKFCIHPAEQIKKTKKIGGTKQYNLSLIKELKPDLIIGNKEENQQEQIELLMQDYPVWMSDIYNLDDAITMIRAVGELVDRSQQANLLADNIEKKFNALPVVDVKRKAAYFIWESPYMLAGQQTFINEMLRCCGLENVIDAERYPETSLQELKEQQPELILLSSEPYPFKEKHIKEFRKEFPDTKVIIVDGEMFSWYGSRLLKAPDYFKKLMPDHYG